MKLIICTNTELLRPIWGDVFDAANWFDTDDWDQSIATAWVDRVRCGIMDAGLDYDLESSFQYWSGGPGYGHIPCRAMGEEPEWLSTLIASADALARKIATADVADMHESTNADA